ncbi:MAG: universal stress protein [Xanthomonadales bacterium]|nr:universal stress protein [Xanthomonadales bacterium]
MPFSRILVPLDGSDYAEQALVHAGRMARAFSSRIFLLRVLSEVGDSHGEHSADCVDWRLRKAEAQRYLRNLIADERLAGAPVESEVMDGQPAEAVAQFIEHNDIRLVVLSAWGAGGASGLPYGGTVHKVLANIRIPYLIVRGQAGDAKAGEPYRHVMVSLDGSQPAEVSLHVASALDRDGGMKMELLHVVSEPLMPRRRPLTAREQSLKSELVECNRRVAAGYLEELRDRLASRHEINTRLETSARPVETIAEVCLQERPDLLVLAVHHNDGESGWSSEAVRQVLLTRITTPVLALQDGMRVGQELLQGSH